MDPFPSSLRSFASAAPANKSLHHHQWRNKWVVCTGVFQMAKAISACVPGHVVREVRSNNWKMMWVCTSRLNLERLRILFSTVDKSVVIHIKPLFFWHSDDFHNCRHASFTSEKKYWKHIILCWCHFDLNAKFISTEMALKGKLAMTGTRLLTASNDKSYLIYC